MRSVLREDRGGRETVLCIVEAAHDFLKRKLNPAPGFRADASDSSGADGLDDQVGLEPDLNATATMGCGTIPAHKFAGFRIKLFPVMPKGETGLLEPIFRMLSMGDSSQQKSVNPAPVRQKHNPSN